MNVRELFADREVEAPDDTVAEILLSSLSLILDTKEPHDHTYPHVA